MGASWHVFSMKMKLMAGNIVGGMKEMCNGRVSSGDNSRNASALKLMKSVIPQRALKIHVSVNNEEDNNNSL